MSSIVRDVRFAVRSLTHAPAFAISAILTLALGVGATSAVFVFVNSVLLRPLPYRDPDGVVLVWALKPDGTRTWLSVPELEDLQRRAPALEAVAGLTDMRFALTGAGSPEELSVVGASASLFPLLGSVPQAGRHFTETEDVPNAPLVAVLSDSLWRRRFGAAPDIIGRIVVLDGRSYAVVGVAAPAFTLLPPSSVFPSRVDVWVPLQTHLPSRARDVRYLHAVGRLRTGATLADARAQLAAAGAELSAGFTEYRGTKWSFAAVRMADDVVQGVRPALLVLLTIVALVLFIACANVAALLLSRATSRRREMAVRAAIGASRSRIARQLLTEGFVLSAIGGTAGLAIAAWTPLLAHAPPLSGIPRFDQVTVDWRVALFAAGISMVTSVVFAMAPLFELSRNPAERQETLRATGRGHRAIRAGQLLAVAQIAIAAVVLVVALGLARSFAGLLATDLGLSTEGLVTMRIALPPRYATEDVPRFFDAAVERVTQIPGVRSAAAVTQLPLSGASLSSSFTVDGRIESRVDADLRGTTNRYFDTLHIPLLEGRAFTSFDDSRAAPVAIVDDTFARRVFPGESAVGKRIRWIRQPDRAMEIVGVVRAVRHRGMEVHPRETVYRPHAQYVRHAMTLAIRGSGSSDPMTLAQPAIAAVHSIDPNQPVAEVATMTSLARRSVAASGFGAAIATTLAALAVTLTVVGVYGLFSFAVAQRRREIGIRIALGESPSNVVRLLLGQGARLALTGLVVGFPVAFVVSRLVAAKLTGTSAAHWTNLAPAAATLLIAIAAACWLPARRASRVSPAEPLRTE